MFRLIYCRPIIIVYEIFIMSVVKQTEGGGPSEVIAQNSKDITQVLQSALHDKYASTERLMSLRRTDRERVKNAVTILCGEIDVIYKDLISALTKENRDLGSIESARKNREEFDTHQAEWFASLAAPSRHSHISNHTSFSCGHSSVSSSSSVKRRAAEAKLISAKLALSQAAERELEEQEMAALQAEREREILDLKSRHAKREAQRKVEVAEAELKVWSLHDELNSCVHPASVSLNVDPVPDPVSPSAAVHSEPGFLDTDLPRLDHQHLSVPVHSAPVSSVVDLARPHHLSSFRVHTAPVSLDIDQPRLDHQHLSVPVHSAPVSSVVDLARPHHLSSFRVHTAPVSLDIDQPRLDHQHLSVPVYSAPVSSVVDLARPHHLSSFRVHTAPVPLDIDQPRLDHQHLSVPVHSAPVSSVVDLARPGYQSSFPVRSAPIVYDFGLLRSDHHSCGPVNSQSHPVSFCSNLPYPSMLPPPALTRPMRSRMGAGPHNVFTSNLNANAPYFVFSHTGGGDHPNLYKVAGTSNQRNHCEELYQCRSSNRCEDQARGHQDARDHKTAPLY